jgi:hypothetical protein
MTSYTLMALSNAKPGREDEYNKWFDGTHVPEILAVDGFVSAQRLKLASAQRTPGPHPYTFAALYRIETSDIGATLNALGRAVQIGTKTDATDPERRAIWVFEPMGPERKRG